MVGVPVLGCDGRVDGGQRLVAGGELAATIVMPVTAGTAVELVARWVADRQPPLAQVVLPPSSYPPRPDSVCTPPVVGVEPATMVVAAAADWSRGGVVRYAASTCAVAG